MSDEAIVVRDLVRTFKRRGQAEVRAVDGLTFSVRRGAIYPLLWGLRASAVFQNLPGIPRTASYVATNAEIRPSLGRNLGQCRGAATCNGTTTVELIEPNTLFEERITQMGIERLRGAQHGRILVVRKTDRRHRTFPLRQAWPCTATGGVLKDMEHSAKGSPGYPVATLIGPIFGIQTVDISATAIRELVRTGVALAERTQDLAQLRTLHQRTVESLKSGLLTTDLQHEYVATGSGSLHAGTVVKVGYAPDLSRDDALNLACRALWEAADADSATGGPDALRGIYPVVATITGDGWQRVTDDELATRYADIAAQVRTRS